MRKTLLIIISFLMLACSTLTIQDLGSISANQPADDSARETLVADIVQATINASEMMQNTPTPQESCPQAPCPTCAAAAVEPIVVTATPDAATEATRAAVSTSQAEDAKSIEATATPEDQPFWIQTGSPAYLPNFAHQDLACNWIGVGGQVFDLNGEPLKNVVLLVEGQFNGKKIAYVGVSGMTDVYGPGGYEIVLGSKPAATNGTLTVTVYALNGIRQSEMVSFNTIDDCQKNLTIINFKQVK
ncbi:MAG: hypothetical protein LWX83_19585 [Anaerolineae bacterium]|nr:hypothetical protein [Anaerolineae bacterium]